METTITKINTSLDRLKIRIENPNGLSETGKGACLGRIETIREMVNDLRDQVYDTKLYQHLKTKNDVNGNPRRLWLFYDLRGCVTSIIDEGYAGRPDTTAIELPEIDISIADYKSWKSFAKSRGMLNIN